MTRAAALHEGRGSASPVVTAALRPEERGLLAALAELLSYPGERTAAAADRAGAADLFGGLKPAAIEELYTSTFDLQPACAPYLGHHLLGEETGRRGPFLARLLEVYARDGFTPREELADHVAEVLRFLAVASPGEERDDLVRDGLLPALRAMAEALEDPTNPYREVLAMVRRAVASPGGAAEGRA